MAMTSNWTEQRVADLRRMWNEGLSASQIARRLGNTTKNAVIGKAYRLDLASSTKWTEELTAELKSLSHQRLSTSVIASRLGVTEREVLRRRRESGVVLEHGYGALLPWPIRGVKITCLGKVELRRRPSFVVIVPDRRRNRLYDETMKLNHWNGGVA